MRSKLFVPASRPELFAKALAGPADALCFDLEDSVAGPRKAEARAALEALLLDPATQRAGKTLLVRVNAADTPHFVDDISAVARAGVALINLPKPSGPAQIGRVVAALESAERGNSVAEPIGLLLNIESPSALRQAGELAGSHARVAGLQIGLGDLFEPLGIDRRDGEAVRRIMLDVRLAAGEAGVWAYDSAFSQVADADGFIQEASWARRLGLLGKSCIHPRQVPLANGVFQPTPGEIEHARRVVAAAENAEAENVGAYMVDGAMVDAPFVAHARTILRNAGRGRHDAETG